MKPVRSILPIAILIWICLAAPGWAQENKLADILIQAETAGLPIPVLSIEYPAMDTAMAYQVQRAYIQKRLTTDVLAGFKAGLTSKGGQARFKVSEPLAGALFGSGKLTGQVILASQFHRPMVETEIGLVLGAPLDQPVPDIDSLKKAIKAVMPVIELPDLGFTDMKQLKGVDIIAANVSSRYFIPGPAQARDDFDLNQVSVDLFLDGEVVNQGMGKDASGDQWQAALWMVNKIIDQGWTLEPGQLLITGALGKMIPGKPGKYTADYGDFGKIQFEIR